MLIILGYPRSGSTMMQYLLEQAWPTTFLTMPTTKKVHGHDMINSSHNSISHNHSLLMILRDYKECILSHLTRDNDQCDLQKVDAAFVEYVKVLEVYEKSEANKTLVYYEDLITDAGLAHELKRIGNHFNLMVDSIIRNLYHYRARAMQNYVNELGATQTTGQEKVHFAPLTANHCFDWDQTMRDMNPLLYDKYLVHYGVNNE